MEKVYFKDLFDVSSGLSKGAKELANGDNPFLTFKTIFNNTFLPDVITDTANTSEIEQKKYSVERGDVFLTRTSETTNELGMSSVALKDYPNAVFNGFSKRLRLKPEISTAIDLKYLGYFLRSRLFRDQVDAMSNTSTRSSLNIEMINRLYLVLPDLSTQERIGNMLYLLDDKIKNNSAINQNLSDQIETLLLAFIDGENTTPVKLGDYLYIKGRIGWKGLKKSEYLTQSEYRIINGETLTKSGIDWDKAGYISKERYDESPEIMLNIGDILLSKDGTIGKIGYVDALELPTSVASGIFVIRNNKPDIISTTFIYYLLKSKLFEAFIAARTEGSVIPHLYQKDFMEFEFPLPNKDEMARFEEITEPMFSQIVTNLNENKKLSALRDSLLPKLMSGELDVSEIEI